MQDYKLTSFPNIALHSLFKLLLNLTREPDLLNRLDHHKNLGLSRYRCLTTHKLTIQVNEISYFEIEKSTHVHVVVQLHQQNSSIL